MEIWAGLSIEHAEAFLRELGEAIAEAKEQHPCDANCYACRPEPEGGTKP
jgi:hypothetical protein